MALGSELARRVGAVATVAIAGRESRISGVMPSTGSGEDVALLVPLAELQAIAVARDPVHDLQEG